MRFPHRNSELEKGERLVASAIYATVLAVARLWYCNGIYMRGPFLRRSRGRYQKGVFCGLKVVGRHWAIGFLEWLLMGWRPYTLWCW